MVTVGGVRMKEKAVCDTTYKCFCFDFVVCCLLRVGGSLILIAMITAQLQKACNSISLS